MFGSIVGAGLGFLGVKETNQANEGIASARNVMEREEAEKAREFSSGEAELNRAFAAGQAGINRDFQERMSSSAVSRRMTDMKSAGINPILAGKFDASSPGGNMAAGVQPATAKANAHGYTAQNKLQGLLSNLGTVQQLRKLTADTKLTSNKAGMTDLPGKVGTDMGKGYEAIKGGFGKWAEQEWSSLTNGAAALSKQVEQTTNEMLESLKNAPGGRRDTEMLDFRIGPHKGQYPRR